MVQKLQLFFEESKQELRRVNWPTKQETIRYTLFVIGLSIVVAAILGFFDFIFVQVLENVIQ